MTFGREVQRFPVGVHVGKILVVRRVDGRRQRHRLRKLSIGQNVGAVDIQTVFSVPAVTGKIHRGTGAPKVNERAVVIFLVEIGEKGVWGDQDASAYVGQVVKAEKRIHRSAFFVEHGDLLDLAQQSQSIAASLYTPVDFEFLNLFRRSEFSEFAVRLDG